MSKDQIAGIIAVAISAIISLIIIFGLIGWAVGWFEGAKETASFDNSKAQATAVESNWQGMRAAAQNVCSIEKARQDKDEDDPTLLEDPAFAYEARYRMLQTDYNRRMANAFEAAKIRRLAGISELPTEAPDLEQMKRIVCR